MDSRLERRKTYRVVGNPDASHRKPSSARLFVWGITGTLFCALAIYIVRILADWF